MLRNVVAGGIFGTGAAISALPTILLFPICLVPGVIIFVVSMALVIKGMYDASKDDDGTSGLLLLLPFAFGGAGTLICLTPALLPGGIGYFLAKTIAPKNEAKLEYF